jgi:protein-tyrosine-phosphatase
MVALIIFVCTSNTCRSPMAEHFASAWLVDKNLQGQYKIISRGLTDKYEPPNSPASPHAVDVLAKDFSLDLSPHRSSLLSSDDVNEAYLIIGVTQSHKSQVIYNFPNSLGKVHSFNANVPDPWHATLEVYSACAHLMRRLVYEILTQLITT